jgi:DNA topoisomerase-6 subunit B
MPPTECLSPIGELLIKKGMKQERPSDFVVTHTRPKPSVYSGHPFQVEAGLVYGGDLPKDDTISILRFANRVPLLFQQGACVITKAVEDINWKRYGLEQKGGKGIPHGPVLVLVHVASTKVPFTSESKEAIAEVPDIKNEVELALRACAKKMLTHIRKKKKYKKLKEKETIIRQILPLIAQKSSHIIGKPVPKIEGVIAKIMNSVLIDDIIEYKPKGKGHEVTVEVTNYTKTGKSFDLLMALPLEAKVIEAMPRPSKVDDGTLIWSVKRLKSLEKRPFRLVLGGMEQDEYEENELYIKGIDPEIVSGADAWDPEAFSQRKKEEEEEGEIPEDEEASEDDGSEEE